MGVRTLRPNFHLFFFHSSNAQNLLFSTVRTLKPINFSSSLRNLRSFERSNWSLNSKAKILVFLFFFNFFLFLLSLFQSFGSSYLATTWICITLWDLSNNASFIRFRSTSENFHLSRNKFQQRATICVPVLRITFMTSNSFFYQHLSTIMQIRLSVQDTT